MSEPKLMSPAVAVIGGGPAGLSVAADLAPAIDGEVLVLDREANTGGIPRHANHPGYGVRDRHRFFSGPKYARVLSREAQARGAKLMPRIMITGWADDETLEATSPDGLVRIRPEVFCFATGARERPRTARWIPGDRCDGIFTTGQLQNWVHLHHRKVGKRAVVIGAELVSWSAVLTLAEAGCRTEALVTSYPKSESYMAFREPGKVFFRTRVEANSKVVAVHGRPQVTGVEVEDIRTGERKVIECDTVVFTGDWIPDNELLRMAGIELDPVSLAPVVDTAMRTSRDGIFAVGNLTHPVETADVVALEGRFAAVRIRDYLAGAVRPDNGVRIRAEKPIRWITPGIVRAGDPAPARNRLVCWIDEFITTPVVHVRQGGEEISSQRLMWPAAPGRAFRIPASLLEGLRPDGGDATIHVS